MNGMRKGQEEMVGFIMIVVLVTVVLLIFLGLSLRTGGDSSRESTEVHQFLESSMEFTTDCAIGYIPAYTRLGELIKECNRNTLCLNGENACDMLNETLNEVIGSSFTIAENRPLKGYEFEANFASSANASAETEIIGISKGTCEGSRIGAEYFIPASPGIIISKLELCY